ncbi:hypothetical protein HY030_03175 [Candidatus Gottesmanbacteria bacterium]|nr:hypothetical protein [Candidatus Gottesmanbacteria bacterium]
MKRFFIIVLAGFTIGFLATIASIGTTPKKHIPVDTPFITTPPPASGEIPATKEQPVATSSDQPFGVGQFCGGIGNISCPPGLVCRKEQETSGFCQPK